MTISRQCEQVLAIDLGIVQAGKKYGRDFKVIAMLVTKSTLTEPRDIVLIKSDWTLTTNSFTRSDQKVPVLRKASSKLINRTAMIDAPNNFAPGVVRRNQRQREDRPSYHRSHLRPTGNESVKQPSADPSDDLRGSRGGCQGILSVCFRW